MVGPHIHIYGGINNFLRRASLADKPEGYEKIFSDAGITNVDMLPELTDAKLSEIGITKPFHRKRILRHISLLGQNQGQGATDGDYKGDELYSGGSNIRRRTKRVKRVKRVKRTLRRRKNTKNKKKHTRRKRR
jgi:hypothetical protein